MDVIDFEAARIRIALKRFESTGEVADYLLENGHLCQQAYRAGNRSTIDRVETSLEINRLYSYIDAQAQFNCDYAELANFKTNDPEFMFPTVLSKYRRGINPVNALYHSLQEALFQYSSDNETYVWIINLFKDKEWLNRLLYAVQKDRDDIQAFCHRYYRASLNSNFIANEIRELKQLQKNFDHYAEVFLLMNDWDKKY